MNELRAEAIAAQSPSKSWAYVALTKPDVTFLVVITTVAGFYLGSSGAMDWMLLLHTLCGTLLVAGGTAALNQYVERDMDAVMRRTAARPLPSGQLQPREVLDFWFRRHCSRCCVARGRGEHVLRRWWRWPPASSTSASTRR